MSASGEAPRPGENYSEGRIQALRAHPRMGEALRHSVLRSIAFYQAYPVMHRNLKDVSRFALGAIALYLDATGGLTHRRLRELSGQSGIISTGAATALLLRLRLIGYVMAAEVLPSGATKLYRPTETMTTAYRERMKIELEACAKVDETVLSVLQRLEEPGVFQSMMSVLGLDSVTAAGRPHPDARALDRLSLRTAGLMILFQLMADADQGGVFPPVGEVEVSVAALARRYEVSRSHVLTILREAEDWGMIRRLGEGRWWLEPELGKVFSTFYAVLYLGMVKAARAERAGQATERRRS